MARVSTPASSAQWSSWREAVLQLEGHVAAPPPGKSPPPRRRADRPSRWVLILAHCLDLIALLLLGAVAALLRFGDVYLIHPQLKGVGGLCNDRSYAQVLREATIDIPEAAVYTLVILAPAVLIALLELLLTFSLWSNPTRATESKSTFFYKRLAKMTLMFALGLCITSIVTDVLRLLVSRPRPYFLADDEFGFLRYCMAGSREDEVIGAQERNARLSFPCHRCCMLAFSGTLVALHAERALRRLTVGGLYVLRALMAAVPALPALLVASQALESRSNHWQDIVVGLLLGALLAAYVVLVLGRDLEAQVEAMVAAAVSTEPLPQTLPCLRVGLGPPSQQGQSGVNRGLGPQGARPAPPSAAHSVQAINGSYQRQRLDTWGQTGDVSY